MQPSYPEVCEFVRRIQAGRYKVGGRTYEWFDCWGILWLFWRDIGNIQLTDWTGLYTRTDSLSAGRCIVKGLQEFEPIVTPRLGDGVLFKSKHWHIALVLDNQHFIHVDKGMNPHVADLRKLDLGGNETAATGKKQGFYRPLCRSSSTALTH